MRFLVRAFFFLILLAILAAGGAYVVRRPPAGAADPDRQAGQVRRQSRRRSSVVVTAPGATLSKLQIVFEQNGKQTPLYTQGDTAGAAADRIEADRIHITREIGKQTVPDSSRARPRSSSPRRARWCGTSAPSSRR